MRHFLRIAEGIDVLPTLNALAVNADLWNENRLRTAFEGSPHAACDDCWVRFNRIPENETDVIDDVETIPYRAWDVLPVKDLILDLMRRVGGVRLGRVIITRLAPGRSIAPHVDGGAPADYYSRYHIALQSHPGCLNYSGDECVQYNAGDVWWFDNKAEHSIVNNSADDRIVIVVDIKR